MVADAPQVGVRLCRGLPEVHNGEEKLAALDAAGLHVEHSWDFPHDEHPEHELAPLPGMYGVVAVKG